MQRPEKPSPQRCACGKPAVIVSAGSRRMVSCSDPGACSMRTGWHKNEADAVRDWNTTVDLELAKRRAGKGHT